MELTQSAFEKPVKEHEEVGENFKARLLVPLR